MRGERKRGSNRNGKGRHGDLPGIVIAGGWMGGGDRATVGLRAFVYGEKSPSAPTLPFGRWKQASTL